MVSVRCITQGAPANVAYPKIDISRNQIRVLRLHHGNRDDELRVTLSVENLSQDSKYEALSYVWGDGFSEKALVNGTEIPITENLHAALRQFRHPASARLMWVDAMCINQQFTSERNHQVQLMGQIFSSAQRVLLWLGPAADDSDYVLDYIREEHPADILLNLKFRFALHALCSRAWFTRIWIVQEVALGKQDPILVCGQKGLRWSKFVRFLAHANHILRGEIQAPQFPYAKFKTSWRQFSSCSRPYGTKWHEYLLSHTDIENFIHVA
ncbi:unnamed protein product [Clonostachys rosea]|uniref:Heterokaryon incompatibility domain-containing protein n=1 Tax=Bionectria ochroleuca TaxID=29856 RepID=A0ABY6UCD2_BIOOC|nr:unnamed protein product [Clonostachys rosea]